MIAPSKNKITLHFGATTKPYSTSSPHRGTDYSYSPDNRVYAPEDGRISFVFWDGQASEGNMAVIISGNHRHALCHLEKFHGPQGMVKQGDVIGVMGNTGTAIGKHLHWAFRKDGVLMNGTKFIGEDMHEGRTAKDWAIEAKDAQPYKQQVIKSAAWTKGMAQNVNNVKLVIDDLEKFKAETLAHPSGMKLSTAEEVNLLWQLNGLRAPTEKEVKEALGRDLNEYLGYFLKAQPVKDNLAKVKYYDQDVQANKAEAEKYRTIQKVVKELTGS